MMLLVIFTTPGFVGAEIFSWELCYSGLLLLWQTPEAYNLKKENMYFGSWFERFQFMAG